ncbi:unnamed protein product [Boreogadus saida]
MPAQVEVASSPVGLCVDTSPFTEGQVCPTDTASAGDQVGANKKSCLQEVLRCPVSLFYWSVVSLRANTTM